MKRFFNALLFLSIFLPTGDVHAQTWIDRLNAFAGQDDTMGVWKGSSGYLIAGPGSITKADGTVEEGTVVFNVTPDHRDITYIYFTPAAEMKAKKMDGDDISSFTVKGRRFFPIRTKEDDLSIGHKTIFMEMLNETPGDKFRLYQLRVLEANTMGGTGKPYVLKRGFYVLLPDFKNAHEIVDITFIPFAKKMSELLKDCPELADKIKNKQDGYKYNMFNGAANDVVFFRIMEEYNHCGE